MLREKIVSLVTKSIKEELSNIEDYSTIYYKVRIADNFIEGGVFNAKDDAQSLNYLISYIDSLEFFKIYNKALLTNERFNNIEIRFDKALKPNPSFTWDKAFYDADVAGNQKLKKKETMQLLSEFEIRYLSPLHSSYPAWPGGERFLQLYQTNTNTQIVRTNGLSDGEDHPYEICLETDNDIDPESFSTSWQANLVYELGKIVPNVPDLRERIKQYKYLTVQIEIDGAPPEWSLEDANGNIGLFIGLDNIARDEFAGTFVPLNIKLMRPEELLYSLANGHGGRVQLAQLYLQQGNPNLSNLERVSVV